jgi:hypothetical protein
MSLKIQGILLKNLRASSASSANSSSSLSSISSSCSSSSSSSCSSLASLSDIELFLGSGENSGFPSKSKKAKGPDHLGPGLGHPSRFLGTT